MLSAREEAGKAVKLYLVEDHSGWGWSMTVVRAESPYEAAKLAGVKPGPRVSILDLDAEGPSAILWCYEDSPDTGPD